MARVTVEDCLENVDNRFELVILAAKRARQLSHGADPLVDRERDKDTVVALREIAGGHITTEVVESIQNRTNAAKSVLGMSPEEEQL